MKLGGSLKVFRIGSCRGFNLPPYRLSPLEFCNQALGYTHGTKEVIQLIKLLRGETNVPRELYPYIFSFYSGRDRLLDFERCWDENARALRECDAVVMEISSCKEVRHPEAYLQYVLCTRPEIQGITPMGEGLRRAVNVCKQDSDTLAADLETIAGMLPGKLLVFTPHINASVSDEPIIPERQLLEQCLASFATSHSHRYYSAWEILGAATGKYICEDLTHLTPKGALVVRKKIAQLLINSRVGALLTNCEQLLDTILFKAHSLKRFLIGQS